VRLTVNSWFVLYSCSQLLIGIAVLYNYGPGVIVLNMLTDWLDDAVQVSGINMYKRVN
jgi:hypothetical protein